MKASELKLLILEELSQFNEFRPSKDSWCSVTSILRKLQVSDMQFARSVVQSLIEDGLINHMPGPQLNPGQFELLVRANIGGIEFINAEKQKRALRDQTNDETDGKSLRCHNQQHSAGLLNRPIGNIGITVFAAILAAMAIYLIKTYLEIPL